MPDQRKSKLGLILWMKFQIPRNNQGLKVITVFNSLIANPWKQNEQCSLDVKGSEEAIADFGWQS